MRHAAVEIFQAECRIRMNVAVNFGMFFHGSKHRLIAQRAAAEQATDVLLLWSQTGANLFNQRPVERMQIQTLFFHAGQQYRFQRRLFSTAGKL